MINAYQLYIFYYTIKKLLIYVHLENKLFFLINMSAKNILKLIKDKQVEYVDLRFTDPRGKLQHVTQDLQTVDEDMLNDGIFFVN